MFATFGVKKKNSWLFKNTFGWAQQALALELIFMLLILRVKIPKRCPFSSSFYYSCAVNDDINEAAIVMICI